MTSGDCVNMHYDRVGKPKKRERNVPHGLNNMVYGMCCTSTANTQ